MRRRRRRVGRRPAALDTRARRLCARPFSPPNLRTPTVRELRAGVDGLPSFATIVRLYGTTSSMFLRHGYQPRRHGAQGRSARNHLLMERDAYGRFAGRRLDQRGCVTYKKASGPGRGRAGRTSWSATPSTASTAGTSGRRPCVSCARASTTCRATPRSGACTGTLRTCSTRTATGSARAAGSLGTRAGRHGATRAGCSCRTTQRPSPAARRPRATITPSLPRRRASGRRPAGRPTTEARPRRGRRTATVRTERASAARPHRGSLRSPPGLRPRETAGGAFSRRRSKRPPPMRTNANDGENATSAASKPPPSPAAP